MIPKKEIVYIAKAESVATTTVSKISIKNKDLTVKEIIKLKSEKYELNHKMFDEIIKCESTYRVNVTHDGGRGWGPTGYHKATFNESLVKYKKETNQNLNYYSAFDQIELMAWDFKNNPQRRFLWSSYVRYAEYGTCDVKKIKQILAQK
jgi:hypothetical protein